MSDNNHEIFRKAEEDALERAQRAAQGLPLEKTGQPIGSSSDEPEGATKEFPVRYTVNGRLMEGVFVHTVPSPHHIIRHAVTVRQLAMGAPLESLPDFARLLVDALAYVMVNIETPEWYDPASLDVDPDLVFWLAGEAVRHTARFRSTGFGSTSSGVENAAPQSGGPVGVGETLSAIIG